MAVTISMSLGWNWASVSLSSQRTPRISSLWSSGATIVSVSGDMVRQEAAFPVMKEVIKLLAKERNFVIDLGKVEKIDSAGVGELVAIKTGADPDALRREAEILAALDHPGVVHLKDWSIDPVSPRLVLRFVNAPDLGTFLQRHGDTLDDEALCDLLLELRGWQRATGGTFDPAVGSLIAAWGLREGGRWPSPTVLEEARRDAGLDAVELAVADVERYVPERDCAGAVDLPEVADSESLGHRGPLCRRGPPRRGARGSVLATGAQWYHSRGSRPRRRTPIDNSTVGERPPPRRRSSPASA